MPGDDILTSAAAADSYNISVETWGESLSRAGGRICRELQAKGMVLPFACPVSEKP